MSARTPGPRALAACLSIVASVAPGIASADGCGTRSPTLEALGEAYFELGETPSAGVDRSTRDTDGTVHGHDGGTRGTDGPLRHDDGWARGGDGTARRGGGTSIDVDPSTLAPHDPLRERLSRLARLLERLERTALVGGDGERRLCGDPAGEPTETVWHFDLEQLERVETLDGRTSLTAFEARHSVRTTPPDRRLVAGSLVAEAIDLPPRWYVDAEATALRASHRYRRAGAARALCVRRCTYLVELELTARAAGERIELERTLYVNGLRSERVVWRLDS